MEPRTLLSAVSWSGGGDGQNWDDPLNWNTGTLPGSADDVTINIAANVVHSNAVTDSIKSLTSTQPLTLSGGTLSIAGASTTSGSLSITGGTLSGTGDITVSGPLTLSAGTVDMQNGTLRLQGGGTGTGGDFAIETGAAIDFDGTAAFSFDQSTTFSGAGTLIKDGPTTLTIAGNSTTFTGPTTVNAGTLLVNGSQPGSAVSVTSGSTLGGTGTVGPVTTTGSTVSPGDSPGILNVQGNVTLDPASIFDAELNGTAPGTGFDQLNVTGAVNLNGSTLSRSVGAGFTPQGGESFSIIRSTAPIVGTFHGLAEGADSVIGGHPFKISYAGGGGHNVVLTVIGPVQPPQFLSANNTTLVAGTAGTFTVTAVGGPTPSLSETGALPSGVTFVDNSDGSATLAGIPAAGSGGIYHLMITASNGQAPDATQNFTLTVTEAPAITSASATAFATGIATTFTVTTRGFPTSTLNETGALPTGVNFVDRGNGTATLTGTPAAGTAGAYNLMITAANGVGTTASQNFTLNVSPVTQAPAITSAASTSFTTGNAGTFTVTSTGLPTPSLTETGSLPSGVTFVDNGNGTATLAGKPAAGAAGVYDLMITAANGVGSGVSQSFTLTVNSTPPTTQAPNITSAGSTTFAAGKASTFTVTSTGLPTPTLSEAGTLPAGVVFVNNGDGTATLAGTPAASAAGAYHFVITASNGVGTAATQNFTFNVAIVTPPKVLRLQRFGVRTQPTRIVLTFDEPMNLSLAQLTSNYVFRPVIRGRVQTRPRQAIKVASAVYNAASQTVTLRTAKRLNLQQVYQITVNGMAPQGVTNASGVLLDGKGTGLAGSNLVMSFAGKASQKGIPGPG